MVEKKEGREERKSGKRRGKERRGRGELRKGFWIEPDEMIQSGLLVASNKN